MKALYIVYGPFPDGSMGQRTLTMAKALRAAGFEVTFLVERFNGLLEDNPENKCDIQGFQCYAFNKSPSRLQPLRYLAYGTNIISWLKLHATSAWDFIIIYNPLAIQSTFLQEYCDTHRIPLIVDCTEWRDSQLYPGIRWLWHRFDATVSARYLNIRAKNIIAISSYLAHFYASHNAHVIRIPPLIDVEDATWQNLAQYPVATSDQVRIMYGGRPGLKDAIDKILDAFWLLKQESIPVKLELVGARRTEVEQCGPDAKLRIQQLGDTLIMHGRFPLASQAIQKLNEADALILIKNLGASVQAQFPSKIPEYMALGKPIIVNNTSDIKEYVRDGVDGFILDGNDPEGIAAILQQVVEKRSQLPIMGQNSRHTAETVFDYRNYVSKLANFCLGVKKLH